MRDTHFDEQSTSTKSEEENMDLGVLFNMLRSLFKSMLNGIYWIFNSIFKLSIAFLVYTKKHLLKFIIVAVLGAVIGGVYQYQIKDTLYSSSMTVQANYESIIQLYKDIEYCEGLIAENDFTSLATYFKIDSVEAASIKKIDVNPYTNDNQIILAYNDFIAKLDSNVVENIDFDKFSDNIPKEEFLYHVISVESTSRQLFGKLEKPIINSLARNPYYSKLLETEVNNLKSQENVLIISMIELDSLRQLYKKLSINESVKENASTNFYLGNSEIDKRDIVVFDKYIKANIDLVEVRSEMNLKNEIVNVVSSFNKTGAKVKGIFSNTMIQGFIGGILLVFLYLLILESNRFLITQEEKFKKNS
jgi:hypothetical protein